MFDLFFTNISDRGLVGSFETLEAAIAAGRKFGFEFHVQKRGGNVVGGWTVFGGWRTI